MKTNQSVPVAETESDPAESCGSRVRTLLDPLQPLVSQLKRLHLLLPDCQSGLTQLGLLFPAVVSAPHLAEVLAAFLRFHQVSLEQLEQNKTR